LRAGALLSRPEASKSSRVLLYSLITSSIVWNPAALFLRPVPGMDRGLNQSRAILGIQTLMIGGEVSSVGQSPHPNCRAGFWQPFWRLALMRMLHKVTNCSDPVLQPGSLRSIPAALELMRGRLWK